MEWNKLNVLILTGFFNREHRNGREVNEMLRTLLLETGRFDVRIMEECRGLTPETLETYDVLLMNYEGKHLISEPARRFGTQTENALFDFVAGGKGIIFYHGTTWLDDTWPDEWRKLMGGYFRYPYSRRNPKGDFCLHRVSNHTGITDYMADEWMTVEDDMFAGVVWYPGARTEILCSAYDDENDYRVPGFPPEHHKVEIPDNDLSRMPGINSENAQAWINHYGKGRSVSFAIGHGEGTLKRSDFMTMFVRAAEWAATGRATFLPADRSGEKRFIPWPHYEQEKNPALSQLKGKQSC